MTGFEHALALLRGEDNADPLIETTLSLLTPYAAFLAAVAAGTSGGHVGRGGGPVFRLA